MRHALRDGRGGLFVALIVALAFSAMPAGSAEIFKCVAKDGTALYQNFPCHIDSIGSVPSSPPAAKPNLPPSPTDANATKSNTALAKAIAPAQSGAAGEPRIGMTAEEVRALLGEPEDVVEDEPGSGGRVSVWRYADGRSVQFNNKHRVLAVQR